MGKWIDPLISLVVFVIVCVVVYFIVTLIAAKAGFDAALTKIILYVLGGIAIIYFLAEIVRPMLR